MICPKCQTENPETRKFYRECGAKLIQICPECGIEIETLGELIYSFIEGKEPENPWKDLPLAYTLKFAVEDLKSYYIDIGGQDSKGLPVR